jgi:hypothetical protein
MTHCPPARRSKSPCAAKPAAHGLAVPLLLVALAAVAGPGAEARPLTMSGYRSPSCCPDSDMVAFVQYGAQPDGSLSQSLYVMALDGAGTRRLSTSSIVWDPSYSNDGEWSACLAVRQDEPGKAGLWIISADSGTPRCLASFSVKTAAFAPTFSPDGETIAYIRAEDDSGARAAIWTMDALQGIQAIHPLHHTLTLSQSGGLMWTPDGAGVCFLAVEQRGEERRTGVWQLDLKSEKLKRLHDFEPAERVADLALSPDGTRFAYTRQNGATRQLMVLTQGEDEAKVVADVVPTPDRIPRHFESNVSFTRDSAALVYVSEGDLQITDFTGESRFGAGMYKDECLKHLNDIYNGLRRYALGHNGLTPMPGDGLREDPDFWVPLVRDLLDDVRSLRCPTDTDQAAETSYEIPAEMLGKPFDVFEQLNPPQALVVEKRAFHGTKRLAILTNGQPGVVE